MGNADPQCAAEFCVLAPWFLGVVGFSSGVHISLRSGLFNAVANDSAALRWLKRCSGLFGLLTHHIETTFSVCLRCNLICSHSPVGRLLGYKQIRDRPATGRWLQHLKKMR
jgi:hypothetical protein